MIVVNEHDTQRQSVGADACIGSRATKRTVPLIAIDGNTVEESYDEIIAPILVIVADCTAERPARSLQSCTVRYIREGIAPGVSIKRKSTVVACHKEVIPTVRVIIEKT